MITEQQINEYQICEEDAAMATTGLTEIKSENGNLEQGVYFSTKDGYIAMVWIKGNFEAEYYDPEFTAQDVINDVRSTHAQIAEKLNAALEKFSKYSGAAA